METVYNKTVSTKSDESFQFCYPWHRFTGTTFLHCTVYSSKYSDCFYLREKSDGDVNNYNC